MSQKLLIIDPFDIFIFVTEEPYYRRKIFDTLGQNYTRTLLQNNSDKIYLATDAGRVMEKLKQMRTEKGYRIVMVSPYAQDSVREILQHYKFPYQNLYRFSAAQDRRDITFRDITGYFEVKPADCLFMSAYRNELEEARQYGMKVLFFDRSNLLHSSEDIHRLEEIEFHL